MCEILVAQGKIHRSPEKAQNNHAPGNINFVKSVKTAKN